MNAVRPGDPAKLFARCAAEMERRGLKRFADCLDAEAAMSELGRAAADPAGILLAAAAAGLFPTRQPPEHLADGAARSRDLLAHLEHREYRVRPARAEDLPALAVLEQRCWARGLRTPRAGLKGRIARDPQGQLVLLAGDTVAGAVYSQRIADVAALDGVTAAEAETLHDAAGTVVQLLAVNILPEMQHRALGDQLLELMLIYRSLQDRTESVVGVTLCRNFDRAGGLAHENYIRQRNAQGVLADPILRFHERHGATVERAMPGYRPGDRKNAGFGVLVSYDIRRRRRKDAPPDMDSAGAAKAVPRNRAAIRDEVGHAVRACLGGGRETAFAFDRPLMEMGIDSADLLGLTETLAQRYGLPLHPALLFQHNTAEKIAAYLSERLAPEGAPRGTARRRPKPRTGKTRDGGARAQDVAIVGMACRLPGGLDTPEAFWDCLREGRSVIGPLPAGRWDWPEGIDPAGAHRSIDRGGFLDDVAAFDAPFFRVSPAEAQSMDPQQRILLELCWQAVEHAGYAPDSLAGSRTGVFIGASGSDYARLLDRSGRPAEAHYGTGSAMSVLANRISYFYDLNGPSLLLDTACSSSLVAVHEAVRSIAAGESAQALVGGINLILHPANSIAYYKSGMLSKDGLCRTFDKDANGYVRSEGAVVLLLKPLCDALAAGDQVHAVIKGTACNHGGQASGLTVPNPGQQGRLLQAAWRAAGIDTSALGYIEAHGTGTPLGDPVEVQGIRQAFAGAGAGAAARCGLGSVKTNLGHLEAAAGLAGLLKAVLCLQHRQLPASLHFRELNAHIDLTGTGLHVVDRLRPWSLQADGELRVAGVSSFGSGGTNAHVVVAEHPSADPAPSRHEGGPVLFVLSARNAQQLQAYARIYADWLSSDSGRSVPLCDLAYQLQTGRTAMEARLALVVADHGELIGRLRAFCANPAGDISSSRFKDLTRGDAGAAFVRALIAQRDLDKLALLWLSGVDVDWSPLHDAADAGRRQRIAVPTYPFARHTYWLPGTESPPAATAADATSPHPAGDVAPMLLAPVWRTVACNDGTMSDLFPAPDDRLLVIGASEPQQRELRALYAGAQFMDIDPAVTADALGRQLGSFGNLDHVLWIAPGFEAASAGDEALIARQRSGLLHVFRLVKALLARSYGERNLDLTIVTFGTQAVFGRDAPDPAHAGVHGFAGALAKEFPRWSVRPLDLESGRDWSIADVLRVPVERDGEVLARRGGQWFRRRLGLVRGLHDAPPAYRQNGVYVVIGGAGGIGTAWTRHVVERCQAQVVWIGRRQPDAIIEAELAELARLGPAPVYVVADASDFDSLRDAYMNIKQRWPAVHGVIHAAVGVFDRGIAEMDEQRFGEVLSVKIDASIHVAEVFRAEPLDFLLYFSSIVALEKTGGLAGYAAGGAFEDAFAWHLRGRGGCPAKVINWGHWDVGTGATISDATKTRLQRSGYVPIQPHEAMAALEEFLAAPVCQMALLKTSRPEALPPIDPESVLHIRSDSVPSCIARIPQAMAGLDAQAAALEPLGLFNNAELEAQLAPLFAATLRSLGLGDEADRTNVNGVSGFYQRWLASGRGFLAARGVELSTSGDLARAWRDWDDAKRRKLDHDDLNAVIEFAETCLRALPDILSGRVRATDVIFPNASMRRVEGIYRGNAVADYFNCVLAESLVAAIEGRLRTDPDARLRILEIGAGTGGTTAAVLPRLAPYQQNIAEYAYTDVSKAFLFHAEERFAGPYPYVRPRLFDVEKPLAGQGVEAQHYDVAIATNVLHATRDIRRTLAICKATLRKGGLLLLNEISTRSLFAHLTFGLLEGWWLAEDRTLRIPDAPGLYPETWRTVLEQEGFSTVVFPVPGAHELGQQVIVAESNGMVWQKAAPERPAAHVKPAVVADAPSRNAGRTDQTLKDAANAHVRRLVAKTLRMDGDDVDVREPLEAYGIDSILVVQITETLREHFPDVGSTLLFECQTIDAVSDYLVRDHAAELARLTGVPAPEPVLPASAGRSGMATAERDAPRAPEAIAVVGMSCRFPQADTLEDYWELLKSGRSCIGEIPPDRWPLEGFFHADPDEAIERGKSYGKWGGFLDGVTEFDPLFFNISPKEAVAIDPQERLFLQTAWETLEDAGYTRERLARDFRQQLGVFVGITRTGFDLFGPELWQRGSTVYLHTSFSSVANRLSYFLNARGPSVPVDTMCSSSLTALHQACQSLRSGECELAIAGGVNVYLHPSGYVGLSASRMLSKDGVCRSFGKGGNGFVPGEGVAAVLLKPLSWAIADNDRIYATIRATHVNHGGKTNGYTVPNPQAQADLIRDALRKAGVDARAVSYIEAHGTGTELGDPIEVAGLTQAFRHFTQESGFCALGSVKSNLGHLEAAAGIAGFIKVVLQMRHGQLAPSLNAAELNPNIDFSRTPFVVQQTLAGWQRPILQRDGQSREAPRIAGVSSFGAGGANAHVVVEEYRAPERPSPESPHGCAIVLSAKNEERLRAYARRLHDFIGRRMAAGAPPALPDLAYTLQVGREQMEQRLALVAHSLDDVREKLKAYADGADDVAEFYAGHVREHKDVMRALAGDEAMRETAAAWFERGAYAQLLPLWTKGLDVDWERLHGGLSGTRAAPRRIGLPTYPFARTRCWLPPTGSDAGDRFGAVAAPASEPVPDVAAQPSGNDLKVAMKPHALTLPDPASAPTVFQTQLSRRSFVLKPLDSFAPGDAGAEERGGGEARLTLHDHGGGILATRPEDMGQPAGTESACAALTDCIDWINGFVQDGPGQGGPIKVVLLHGLGRMFAGDRSSDPSAIHGAVAALAGCAVPVIAVMTGESGPDALLLAAACDLTICSAEGAYRFGATAPAEPVSQLLAERFGQAAMARMAEAPRPLRGDALGTYGFTMPVVAAAEVEDYALDTARSIARAAPASLMELKKHLSRHARGLAESLAVRSSAGAPEVPGQVEGGRLDAGFAWPAQDGAADAGPPVRTDLSSEVVTLDAYGNGVAVVTLCDRSSKNTFSPAFIDGVTKAFAHIKGTPGYKAVVLTGYGHYFACGGTREGLLAIQSGHARFTDEQTYAMPLACEIPVIAAMQGHAIGAGWAMGLFCDWAVYSEESVYQSPYMLYGFTPGAGSTLIFPQRFGHDLSREILFTAREFQGRELKQRCIGMPVLPRGQVLDYALALANRLASSRRSELVAQKNRRSQWLRDRLQATFAQELAMHDKTFVGNAAVVANIDRYFGGGAVPRDSASLPKDDVQVREASPGGPSLRDMLAALRRSLAEELHLEPGQIDDEAAFIDLGMDSISAVTWVRKINTRFGLSVAATKVYSYPNLTRFAEFVLSQMGHRPPERGSETECGGEDAGGMLTWLRETLARELSISPDVLDDDVKFVDLGLDSVTAVTWLRTINARYGLSVAATKVYSHPTLSELHRHLLTLGQERGVFRTSEPLNGPAPAAVERPRCPAQQPAPVRSFPLAAPARPQRGEANPADTARPEKEKGPVRPPYGRTSAIAIIGMAGQFPKAESVAQFWQNLVQGRDCVSDIPRKRWSVDAYYDPDRNAPGKTVCRRMGALDDVDMFDPLFFSISPSEAEYMDPQQRLFLQNSWHCIEDAGYDPVALAGSLCGVFVGCGAGDYSQLMARQPQSAQGLLGESVALLPARIAYFLDLQGPCLAIDTACSASLVAIANACDSLILGTSDLALAGGVYVIAGPDIHVKMSKAGMLSPDGRCFTFDQRANGFVSGEGVGVLLLKRLEDAERDGDDIHAVIRGWGVNQDGRTNGITAPNQESQVRLETAVYEKFAIDPEQIQMVEAHGTGTRLGDPIEVGALCESFRRFTDRKNFCALGSVKSNIGHLATAAGVTGVIKSVLALRHGQVPPTINYRTLNAHIDLKGSPFYVNTECRPWQAEAGRKRLAAVSSFGFSGTNAHLVLEEHVARSSGIEPPETAILLPLSARSPEQLARYAKSLSDHLAEEFDGRKTSLADIAYTFQTGRTAMRHRVAVVARTVEELKRRLDDFAATGTTKDDTGDADSDQHLVGLARRWVAGEAIGWGSLYRPGQVRRRHGLPTYPFARERYWAPPAKAAEDSAWCSSELVETVDWEGRFRRLLGQRTLVVHGDGEIRQAFERLLTQLGRVCGLEDTAGVTFCRAGEADAIAVAQRPDCLLLLGGIAEDIPATVRRLNAAHGASTVIVFTQADVAGAERLGRAISAKIDLGRHACLLVSQADCADLETAMQHLFREWLASDEQTAAAAPHEVHYAGTRRLSRAARVPPPSDRMCLIEKDWRPKTAAPADAPPVRGTALVLVNQNSAKIAGKLFEPEDFRRVVTVADDFGDPEAAEAGARALLDRCHDITHVFDLSDLYETPRGRDGDPSGKVAFYQVLLATGDDLGILYLTKGLQPFRPGEMSLSGARFAGLVKMLSADYRHVDARFIDMDQALYDDLGQLRHLLLQELGSVLQETEICYRGGQRFAPALSAMELDEEAGRPRAPLAIAKDAVYVVSGGTNGVGLEIGRYLAGQGCTRLVLMGVTPLPPKGRWQHALDHDDLAPYVRDKLLRLIELDETVAHLEIHTGPLTDRNALRRYFRKVRATLGPIRGVVHAAAVYSDPDTPGFANKDLARMREVWAAKADGLESLHAVFENDPLDFFLSFASMTGVIPRLARGASDYAMANAFVEFFTAYHHQRGETGCKAIVWSDWNQTGAITRIAPDKAAAIAETFDKLGMRTFSNSEGRALFERAMTCEADSSVIIGYIDRQRFARVRPRLLHADAGAEGAEAVPPHMPLVHHIERWEAERRAGRIVPVERITDVIGLDEIRTLEPALIHRIHEVMFGTTTPEAVPGEAVGYAETITATVMEVLKLKSIDPAQPFQNYGLDSISATVLATRLEKRLKREMKPQWLIEFSSVETLSRHLMAQDGETVQEKSCRAEQPVP